VIQWRGGQTGRLRTLDQDGAHYDYRLRETQGGAASVSEVYESVARVRIEAQVDISHALACTSAAAAMFACRMRHSFFDVRNGWKHTMSHMIQRNSGVCNLAPSVRLVDAPPQTAPQGTTRQRERERTDGPVVRTADGGFWDHDALLPGLLSAIADVGAVDGDKTVCVLWLGYTLKYVRCAFEGMPRRRDVPRLFTSTPETRRLLAMQREHPKGFDITVHTVTSEHQNAVRAGVRVRLRLVGCALSRRRRMFVVPSRNDLLRRSWQVFICRVTRFMASRSIQKDEADTVCVQGGGVISATIGMCGLAVLREAKVRVRCISATSGGAWGVFMYNAMDRPLLSSIASQLQMVLFDMSCDLTRLTLRRAPASNHTKNWTTFMQTALRRTLSTNTIAFTNEAALCCYDWTSIVNALLGQFASRMKWEGLRELGCSEILFTTCVLRTSAAGSNASCA
tara:strand:- start:191 stop:1546 length:1356 start_codon:yes stop_codon:yes gene_type:complete